MFINLFLVSGYLMSQTYTFFNFILKPDEQSLFHKNERLDLGLKGLRILVALIENQGKVLSKDELIVAGWDNQIVTDGTLSKQIERIRQILGSYYPDENFVKTIHGIGYQFVPSIKTLKDRTKGLAKWQKAIASISIIPLLLFLYFYPFNQQLTDATSKPQIPFNIAVIPLAQGDDYQNQGGISYLSTLLGKNPRIYHTNPKSEWFASEDKNKLAIELEDQKNLDYVLLVDINEQDEHKTATLELKNSHQFKQQTTLQALTFKQLFAGINAWVLVQLKIKNSIKTVTDDLSHDSFAVESFLQGKKQASIRNYEKAIQYFKIAITQDPKFDLAILNLAHSQIKSNDYISAQAIISTLQSNKELNDELKLYALILQSSIYIRTDKITEAKPIIEQSITLATKLNDGHSLILAYYYQGEMHTHLGELKLSLQSTLNQKKIIVKNSKDKNGLMRIANNLAHTYYNLTQFEAAKLQIEEAISWFEKTNNTTGRMNSYSLLANIQFDLAQYKRSEETIYKALQLKSQVENDYLILSALESHAYIQLALGKHEKLKLTIKEIEDLTVKMGISQPKITASLIKLEFANKTKNIPLIQDTYANLDRLTKDQADENTGVRHLSLTLLTESNLIIGNLDLARKQIDEASQLSKNDGSPYILLNKINDYQWMYKTGLKQQATKKLQQLLNKLLIGKQNNSALTVAYLLLDIDVTNGFSQSYALLQKIKHITATPYPYLKYQAQLAAHNNNYFEASKLMQQMKSTSNDWWNTEEQLLLDSHFERINQ